MALKAPKKTVKNPARKAGKKLARKASGDNLLAKGGGAGPAAGVVFQSRVGALFAAIGLDQAPVDPRLQLGAESISEIRLEAESPVDDILFITTATGRLFVQAKTNLSLATDKSGEMAKTVDQFVRQWRACKEGKKTRGWDYPLDTTLDRFVLAVGQETPATVSVHLAKALSRRREGASMHTTPKTQQNALKDFTALIKAAWKKNYGTAATKQDIDAILDLAVVLDFNFDADSFREGELLLKGQLARKSGARAAFKTLAHECGERMKRRTGFTISEIRRVLEQNGLQLLAPEDYRRDIEALRKRSSQFREMLLSSTRLDIGEGSLIPIPRAVSKVAMSAAENGSFLLVGEPGAGKTGVLADLADQLAAAGRDVVVLKVSSLGLTALKSDLSLAHSFREILENWPGTASAFLLIDGLDEARGGAADVEYRDLIADITALPDRRWKVVASVRTFDLRAGQLFKSQFKGTPPDPELAASGPDMANVRQIEVRTWTRSEFDELMAKAPKLRKAIDLGGDRLREIALVPFNTQLLAEVISLGATEEELGSIRNQTDLLAKYWAHRIEPLGANGRTCLVSTIEAMVKDRGVEAELAPLEKDHGAMLDQLRQAGVLVSRRNGRQIAFRHNILFDYAASKLYLDPFKPSDLQQLFLRDRGLGLILGPPLGYALQELWGDEPDHVRFWALVVLLASDKKIDPIARSLVARRAIEFTKSIADINKLADGLTDSEGSAELQTALVGAFLILIEDAPNLVSTEPWTYLAEQSSTKPKLVGTVASLTDKLLKSELTPEAFERLGRAARNLLAFGYDSPKANPNFVAFCVPLVAGTYPTAPDASKALLERVFEEKRLEEAAFIEVPAIGRGIGTIATHDPEFAVEIYGKIFGHRVSSAKQTSFSKSQIFPMSTSEADMYSTASYALAGHFPEFSQDDVRAATAAVVAVVEGHVATRHRIPETASTKSFQVGDVTVQLTEDGSRYWAWEVDTTHPESTQMILQQHLANLRNANEERAEEIVSTLFSRNRLALLWARLLMVGAERPEVYAPLLWELATEEAILLSNDSRKDAIDAIAAFYPCRTVEDRRVFEEKVLTYGSGDPVYQSVREERLETLFQTIGEQNLITDQAKALSAPKPGEPIAANARPFGMHGGPVDYPFRERLEDNGVDLGTLANSTLLCLIEDINGKWAFDNLPRPQVEDIPAAVGELRKILAGSAQAVENNADRNIIRAARKLLSNANFAVLESAQRLKVTISGEDLQTVLNVALSLSQEDDSQSADSVQKSSVDQLYFLCQHPDAIKAAVKRLQALASNEHPNIRIAVARNLVTLFEREPVTVWKLAKSFIANEQQPYVLAHLVASCLGSLRNHDPRHIEAMILQIRERFPYELVAGDGERDPRASLWKVSAEVLAGLYVWNDRKKARDILFSWAANPIVYEDQLRNVIHQFQTAVCAGYDSDTAEFKAIRQRAHALLTAVIDHSASELEKYWKSSTKIQSSRQLEAKQYAKCLQYAGACLYFGSGAFRENKFNHASPVVTDVGKRQFVHDVAPLLRRLGDIAIPSTIYELVQLLEYLLDGDPALCFDLFTHALMVSGKKHGFQGESLGVDVLVRIVSRCLADHDDIFRDRARRDKLISCLDIFIEAGWPNALRLIYRLPDSLR